MTTFGASQGPGDPQPPLHADALLGFLSDFRATGEEPAEGPEAADAPVVDQTDAQWPAPAEPAHQPPASGPAWAPPEPDPSWAPPGVDPAWAPPSVDPAWAGPGPGATGAAWSPPATGAAWAPPATGPAWSPPAGGAYPPGYGHPGYPPGPGYGAPGAYGYPPSSDGNSTASVALGLGIGSVLIPLLSIPGLILGIKSLRRTRREPWVPGRGRSIWAIVTSCVLGPIVATLAIVGIVNRLQHEDMHRVQSLISSAVSTTVQERTGIAPTLTVDCPSSEPRRAGTVFDCVVTDTSTGFSATFQVRETDSSGDVVFVPATSNDN